MIGCVNYPGDRKGKRQYPNNRMQKEFFKRVNECFRTKVNVPRIMRGERQELETLISEEALLLAQYLRDEQEAWSPRIAI